MLEGRVKLLHYRDDVLIRTINTHNAIRLDGKVDILAKFFLGTANWTTFYVGLLGNTTFTDNNVPIATLTGVEFTGYSTANRPALTFITPDKTTDPANVFTQNNSSNYATYAITAASTIYGLYIVDTAAKITTPSRCWCSAAFGNDDTSPVPLTVAISDTLRIQYTIRIPTA